MSDDEDDNLFDLTDDEEDVVIVGLLIALGLDFFTGLIFGVVGIATGIEDWMLGVIENIF